MTDHDTPSSDDALAVVRRDLGDAHADLQHVQSVVLREGPRAKKTARYVAVRNRHTGEVHHHALTLETGKKIKGSWELDDKRSISFADEEDDEIARLMEFLQQVHPVASAAPAPATGDLPGLLKAAAQDPDAMRALVRAVREAPDAFNAVGAAIGFGRHALGMERLKKLVAAEAGAAELREVLGAHFWLVGSEYGTPVDAEALGEVLLQRSPAGRLEAVWVGPVATGEALFTHDAPGPMLSRALGEAMRVHEVLAGAGPLGVTVVVGTRSDEAELEALGRLNAHLKGIEVVTYLQVLQRGQRVIDGLRATAKGEPSRGTEQPG